MKKYLAILLTMALLLSVAGTALAATVNGTAGDSNGTVTISGSVSPAAEQRVTVLVVEDNTNIASLTASDIVYMTQTTSDGSGNYSVTFTMPVAKRTGTYDVYIGATDVGTPHDTELTYTTEAPTTAPVVNMGSAKAAVNGANAFYYFITITLNNGTATGFEVKHYPANMTVSDAQTQDFGTQNISNAVVQVISVLKGIPDAEADRQITSTATLTYSMGGSSGLEATDTKTTSLNTVSSN